jgi:hypothetical protein
MKLSGFTFLRNWTRCPKPMLQEFREQADTPLKSLLIAFSVFRRQGEIRCLPAFPVVVAHQAIS